MLVIETVTAAVAEGIASTPVIGVVIAVVIGAGIVYIVDKCGLFDLLEVTEESDNEELDDNKTPENNERGKEGDNSSHKEIDIPKNVQRQAKKLSPEAKRTYEKTLDALKNGDLRGLNDHALIGNRSGQRAIDLKGIGKGRGAGRIIYKKVRME